MPCFIPVNLVLQLQLELEEAKLRDDLQRAKLENKALNAKLEYFL